MAGRKRQDLEVVKEFSFAAAHFLPGYPGKCANLHGHEWRVLVGVKGQTNKNTGMVMDFSELKDTVEELIISKVDHTLLNGKEEEKRRRFPYTYPTAERIIEWIVGTLEPVLLNLSFVRLYESPTSYVEWRA